MSYQSCRWYDPYPRLAFALKLMYLAPRQLKMRAMKELVEYLDEHLGQDSLTRQGLNRKNRWYDEDQQAAIAVELLKQSPESVKTRAADALLAILSEEESPETA